MTSLVKIIGSQAFYNNPSLIIVDIPREIPEIPGGAFRGCTSNAILNFNSS